MADNEKIIELLQGAIGYLNKVQKRKNLISDPLQNENYSLMLKEFNNLINGLEALNELLQQIEVIFAIDYTKETYKGKVLKKYIDEFNSFLMSLIEAMENEDYFLVADLVEYEFDNYLNQYKKVFVYLLDSVSKIKVI